MTNKPRPKRTKKPTKPTKPRERREKVETQSAQPTVPPPAPPPDSFKQGNTTLQAAVRRMVRENRGRVVIIVGILVALVCAAVFVCNSGTPAATPLDNFDAFAAGQEVPPPTSTPEPVIIVATPTPLPPLPLQVVVPLNQQGYADYRFYHFWEELSICKIEYADLEARRFAEAATPAPAPPTPEPTATPPPPIPDVEVEKAVLKDLQTPVRWLLERYDLVLQRQFREGCGVMPAWRRGA